MRFYFKSGIITVKYTNGFRLKLALCMTHEVTEHEMVITVNRWEWDEAASDSGLCFACVIVFLIYLLTFSNVSSITTERLI